MSMKKRGGDSTMSTSSRSSPSWRASEAYRNIMKKRMDSVDARAVVVEDTGMCDSE